MAKKRRVRSKFRPGVDQRRMEVRKKIREFNNRNKEEDVQKPDVDVYHKNRFKTNVRYSDQCNVCHD